MFIYTPDSPSEVLLSSRRALFLDRDGVINRDTDYLHKIEHFAFVDGIFDLCRAAAGLDYRIIVVTNQSGIGRGYYTEADFLKVTEWMMREFAEHEIEISGVYACPHLIDAVLERYRRDCPARKPNPGMLLRARDDFQLDLSECIFIGDQSRDMEAGRRAGIGTLVRLNAANSMPAENSDPAITVVADLYEAREKLFPDAGRH
ncbi:MAG: HAD family hydrolase [Victivallaceae bacterium]|nr:HAD family hydrolase [Victivallaceae bacterium]